MAYELRLLRHTNPPPLLWRMNRFYWGWGVVFNLLMHGLPRKLPWPVDSVKSARGQWDRKLGAKKSTQTFFVQSFSTTLRVMDVRAENRGRPHQNVRFPAAPVVGRNFLTPGHSGVRVRNVRRKSGPKSLCLCCFFFPEKCCNIDTEYDRAKVPPHNGNDPPPAPASLKALLFPPLVNNVENKGMQVARARYSAELPPFIPIVRYPGCPVILGMDNRQKGQTSQRFGPPDKLPKSSFKRLSPNNSPLK